VSVSVSGRGDFELVSHQLRLFFVHLLWSPSLYKKARHRRLVECNVIEQCINLFKTGVVQRRRVETFLDVNSEFTTPRIHACVFDPSTGELKQLEVDFKQYMEELHDIYDLYKIEASGNREKEEQEIALKKKMLADLGASPNAPDQAGQNSRGWRERISKIWKGP